jgi:hypothetical protein
MLYDARLAPSLHVHDLISNGKWVWPPEWYSKFSNVTSLVEPRVDTDKKDWVVWKNSKGVEMEFAVKNVYKELKPAGTVNHGGSWCGIHSVSLNIHSFFG